MKYYEILESPDALSVPMMERWDIVDRKPVRLIDQSDSVLAWFGGWWGVAPQNAEHVRKGLFHWILDNQSAKYRFDLAERDRVVKFNPGDLPEFIRKMFYWVYNDARGHISSENLGMLRLFVSDPIYQIYYKQTIEKRAVSVDHPLTFEHIQIERVPAWAIHDARIARSIPRFRIVLAHSETMIELGIDKTHTFVEIRRSETFDEVESKFPIFSVFNSANFT